ncbi:hypothetical protein AZ09_15125 (plasmid) [Acetobacter aceti 1023]|nr:hypothetical protein AZ09_15125 [Acetobacter aceti 1023]
MGFRYKVTVISPRTDRIGIKLIGEYGTDPANALKFHFWHVDMGKEGMCVENQKIMIIRR